jgi:nitrite reductase/ring-hydroxylating ferredoxin subunit
MTLVEQSPILADVVLSDGTLLSSLIDHDRHEVALRMLSDPEIYQIELNRLFARTWIPVGHESEIPNEGDFMLRRIGEDPVIVVRQATGEVTVMLNVCPHRGMQICRSDSGNAPRFRCPYHAWVFGRDGKFMGAPFEKEMYGDTLEAGDVDLERARVETLGGMIFANWDPKAPTLSEHFGDFKWYLDLILERTNGGYEVVGPPQRSLVKSNWKGPAEQGSVDGYHGLGLHRSFTDLGLSVRGSTAAEAGLLSVDISANGGGIRCTPTQPEFLKALEDGRPFSVTIEEAEELLNELPPVGMTREMVPELRQNLTDDQVRVLAGYYPSAGQAFPTFELLHINGPVLKDPNKETLVAGEPGAGLWAGEVAPTLVLHTWGPRGVDAFEIWTWVLAERDASPEVKERARKVAVQTFGSSGTIEMDDGEAWPSQTAAARGARGRKVTFKYRAFRHHSPPPNWPGPGQVHTGATGDDGQWQWWQRYFRFMLGEE